MTINKRKYRKRELQSSETETSDTVPSNSENPIGEEDPESESLEELIELRKYRRRPQGIDAQKLARGDEKKVKKKKKDEDPWKLKTGGLVDMDAVRADKDDEVSEKKIMLDSFTRQTNALDVDKHMLAYIEEEMKKRRGEMTDPDQEDYQHGQTNPHDELFQAPDHLKVESKTQSEGNVQLSTAMLTAIPEVDLGIDVRLKNIEETEKAKRKLLEQRQLKADDLFTGSNYTATSRFYRGRPTVSDHQRDYTHHENTGTTHVAAGGGHNKTGAHIQRKDMATDDIVAERFKKRLRR